MYLLSSHQGFPVKQSYDVEIDGLQALCKTLQTTEWCPGSEPRAKTCPVAVDTAGNTCNYTFINDKAKYYRPYPEFTKF